MNFLNSYNFTQPSTESVYSMALNTPVNVLQSLCVTDPQYRQICYDENFWRTRTQRHFPMAVNRKPHYMSWKDYYLML